MKLRHFSRLKVKCCHLSTNFVKRKSNGFQIITYLSLSFHLFYPIWYGIVLYEIDGRVFFSFISPPSSPTNFSLLSFATLTSTSPPYLLRKGKTSHWYQQNMVYQDVVSLRTFPWIKAGQGNSVWEIVFQKLVKKSETAPPLTVRRPRRSSCIRVTYMQRT